MNRKTVLQVKVFPKKKQYALFIKGPLLHVWVKAPATDGKANQDVIAFLSDYYGLPKRALCIISGCTSRIKLIQVTHSLPLLPSDCNPLHEEPA